MTKTVDKVEKTTPNPNEARLQQLKQLFPECLVEGEVDLTELSKLLNTCSAGGVNYTLMNSQINTASLGQANAKPPVFSTHLLKRL